jgi:hypothetical protein
MADFKTITIEGTQIGSCGNCGKTIKTSSGKEKKVYIKKGGFGNFLTSKWFCTQRCFKEKYS